MRASYAYDVKKPNRYIHSACIRHLDGDMGMRALDTLHNILSNEALDAEILTVAKKIYTILYMTQARGNENEQINEYVNH